MPQYSLQSQRQVSGNRKGGQNLPYRDRQQSQENRSGNQSEVSDLQRASRPAPRERSTLSNRFIRSQMNQDNQSLDGRHSKIDQLENDKTEYVQRLNDSLVQLDEIKWSKRDLTDRLIEQMKFVKDLEKAILHGDDIDQIVDQKMKSEFKREKEVSEHLKEQLRRCDMERQKIFSRIHMLSGDKAIVVKDVGGVRKNYKVSTATVQRLLEDIHSFKTDIQRTELEVLATQTELQKNEESLFTMEKNVSTLFQERDQLHQQALDVQMRNDDGMAVLDNDSLQLNRGHGLHTKLLAMRLIQEKLQSIHFRHMEANFCQIVQNDTEEINQYRGSYNLQRMIINKGLRQQRLFLHRWFQTTFNPIKTQIINDGLPALYEDKKVNAYFFYKWRKSFFKRQQYTTRKKQILTKAFDNSYKFRHMQIQYAFNIWRDKASFRTTAVQKLAQITRINQKKRQNKAFQKWNYFREEQNFHIRMHGLCVEVGFKKMKSSLFMAWRSQTQVMKTTRYNRLLRAFKNMRVYCWRRKQLKAQALGVLGQERQANLCLMQDCFNAMRHYKELRKYRNDNQNLTEALIPKINSLHDTVQSLQNKLYQQQKTRVKHCLAISMQKTTSTAFYKWRQVSEFITSKISHDFKRTLSRIYLNNLRAAFNRWRLGRNYNIIKHQSNQIHMLLSSNHELDQDVRARHQIIWCRDKRQQSQATVQLRKLILRSVHGNMRFYLQRWQHNCIFRSDQEDAAQLLINKVRRKKVRDGFDNYKAATRRSIQDDNNTNRVNCFRMKTYHNTKKKIFMAIQSFANNYNRAKVFIRNLLKRQDKLQKRTALGFWRDFVARHIDAKLQQRQNDCVEDIAIQVCLKGNKQDDLGILKKNNQHLKELLYRQAKAVMQKYVEKSLMASLRTFFDRWHTCVDNIINRENFLQHILGKNRRAMQSLVFARWAHAAYLDDKIAIIRRIKEENKATVDERNLHYLSRNAHQETRVKLHKDRGQMDADIVYINMKAANTVDAIIKRVDENYSCLRMREILLQWHAWAKRRRNCYKQLTFCITRTLLASGFNTIRAIARRDLLFEREEKATWMLIKRIDRCKKRAAFDKWRQHLYHDAVVTRDETIWQTEMKIEKHDNKVDKIRAWHTDVQSKRMQDRTLSELFQHWCKYSFDRKETRIALEHSVEVMEGVRAKKAIQKWKARTNFTLKIRGLQKKVRDRNGLIKKSMVSKAFRAMQIDDRRGCNHLYDALCGLQYQAISGAFKAIKSCYQIRMQSAGTNNVMAINSIAKIMQQIVDKRKRQAYTKIREVQQADNKQFYAFKSIVKKKCTGILRSYFFKWKLEGQMIEVHEENEVGVGPTSLSKWMNNMTIFNLKEMIMKDGHPELEVDEFRDQVQKKYLQLMEKSVCRNLIFKHPDLYLLPACFDRWKAFVHKRLQWKEKINFCEKKIKTNPLVNKVQEAFDAMRYKDSDREKNLFKMTFKQLQQKVVDNYQTLQKVANSFDSGHQGVVDYTKQRNVLLDSYVGSQRLALSAVDNGHWRAKHKVLRNFNDNADRKLKQSISQALEENIAKIQFLKDQAEQIEHQNQHVSEENDHFRRGAVEALSMTHQVDQLNQERQSLSIDAAEHAHTIKRLLEDNLTLNERVAQSKHDIIQLDMRRRDGLLKRSDFDSAYAVSGIIPGRGMSRDTSPTHLRNNPAYMVKENTFMAQ